MSHGTMRTATIVLMLSATGCVRRDGRNSDCRWPGEAVRHPADPRHLSADAEFAEDLAIRYADVHYGLRTPYASEAYPAKRDQCMGALFAQIAKEHSVPTSLVAASLGRNRARIDVAINLPFTLLCCFIAALAARRIWRRYPPAEHGWMPGLIMALFLSLVFALGSTMVGEVWSWIAESYRMGNSHMSYRAARLPWARYRTGLFIAGLVVFWLAALNAARRTRPSRGN